MRIALGGIHIESCTFSPNPSHLEDFRQVRGQALIDKYPFMHKFPDVELVPLFFGRAIPGGMVTQEAYQQMKKEYMDGLKAHGPFDGVYIDFHGAMNVQGMDDAEGDWATSVREIVGPDVTIAASYDLHGNVTLRQVESIDIFTAFRTAPHIDYFETQEKAFTLLVKCLQEKIRPHRAWVRIPVVLPGEKTSTEWDPGMRIYGTLPISDARSEVLDASIWVGYVWADEPRASATVVVTGTDKEVIREEAERIAQIYWDGRSEFKFGVPTGTIDDCIDWALEAEEKSVFISDSGDNPTAGGANDVNLFLKRLIERGIQNVITASIADATALQTCWDAGVGAEVEVSLGGKLDPINSQPLLVKGIVESLVDDGTRQCSLNINGIHAIITDKRRPYHYIRDFQALGLEPLDHKMVVIKIGYLEPDLKAAAPLALMALSGGAVNQDIESLPFKRLQRPIYPLEPDMTWAPQGKVVIVE